MRPVVAIVCWILAVVSGLAAVLAGWTAQNVRSETGYVAMTSLIAADAQVQEAVAVTVGQRLAAENRLPSRADELVSRAVHEMLVELAARPAMVDAWAEIQRRLHSTMFDRQRAGSTIVIDVAPLAQVAVDRLTERLPTEVTVPDEILVDTGATVSNRVLGVVDRSPELAYAAIAVTVVFAFLVLVVARRTANGVLWLGVGALLVAAIVWWPVLDVAVPAVLDDAVPSDGPIGPVVEPMIDLARSSFEGLLTWLAACGAALLAAGLIVRVASRFSDSRA